MFNESPSAAAHISCLFLLAPSLRPQTGPKRSLPTPVKGFGRRASTMGSLISMLHPPPPGSLKQSTFLANSLNLSKFWSVEKFRAGDRQSLPPKWGPPLLLLLDITGDSGDRVLSATWTRCTLRFGDTSTFHKDILFIFECPLDSSRRNV
jgi:hypothetical protein